MKWNGIHPFMYIWCFLTSCRLSALEQQFLKYCIRDLKTGSTIDLVLEGLFLKFDGEPVTLIYRPILTIISLHPCCFSGMWSGCGCVVYVPTCRIAICKKSHWRLCSQDTFFFSCFKKASLGVSLPHVPSRSLKLF